MKTVQHRRRTWSLALSLALFALIAAALLAAAALIVRTINAERAERALIEQTDAVLTAINDIGRAAINAETGQRGYFITLDRRYLAPYEMGREAYPLALRRLETLLAGAPDPRTDALLAQVEEIARARFRELDRSVALVRDGQIPDAQQAILSDEGQLLMQRLRATLNELEAIERARLDSASDETAALESRILPLLSALLAIVCGLLALSLWQVARTARAEAQAAHADELTEARDRADLLARELNHRVKNLFTVILGIVRMTGRDRPEAKPAIERIAQRIHALAKAHEVTQGDGGRSAGDVRHLVETATAPYCSDHEHCIMDGERVALPDEMAVPLGLILHELVTNAVKYGAWAQPGGAIHVAWRREDGALRLDWRETGAAPPPADAPRGFGTQLIDSSARQLGGTIERRFGREGLEVEMILPLAEIDAAR